MKFGLEQRGRTFSLLMNRMRGRRNSELAARPPVAGGVPGSEGMHAAISRWAAVARKHGARAARYATICLMVVGCQLARSLAAHAANEPSAASLDDLSIEELSSVEIQVSSVLKTAEALSDTPAAVYVITNGDIIRSGARTLPEMLRLAPNLQVAQLSASSYAIGARGFNAYGSNKLLVLIDGRSVYTPFFSGVFWDAHDMPPENIDRIEVISGPGTTLWGANAVNGVINVITKHSRDTQGGLVEVGGGYLMRQGTAQYGGRIGDDITYRAYGYGFERSDDELGSGYEARDGWRRTQGGFRVDRATEDDLITVQGDAYRNLNRQLLTDNQKVSGTNVLARWTHEIGEGQALQAQVYFDHNTRLSPDGSVGDRLDVYDLDLQHSFELGTWNSIVWGGGHRIERHEFKNIFPPVIATFFDPDTRTLERSNVFVQDSISVTDTLKLILGLKLEKDAYVSPELIPSARVAWKVTDTDLIWGAVSRAVRAPSRLDRDLKQAIVAANPQIFLLDSGNFQSEKLIAYEIGYRTQWASGASLSVSAFYNVYQDLRSLEPTPGTIIPTFFANEMEGTTYGVEAWGSYLVTNWWRVKAGFVAMDQNLNFKEGSSGLIGIPSAGDDPVFHAQVRSSFDLTRDVAFDAGLRYVGNLPEPSVSRYFELDARLGWDVSDSFNVSLAGFNLLHDRHEEFIDQAQTPPVSFGRSVFLNMQLRF